MSCNLIEILPSDIVLDFNHLSLHQMTLEDVLFVRKHRKQDIFAKETCRPIIQRDDKEYKEFIINMIKTNTIFIFGVYKKGETEILVGQIILSDYNSRNQSVELGYSLLPEYRKNGYMKLAMEKLDSFLFTGTPLNKIYAQTGEFNVSSIKLLDSLRFSCDGRLRQHHELGGILYDDCIYSLIKDDWEKMNQS